MQIERQMQVELEADIHGAVIGADREAHRETYIHAGMHTCMQAVVAIHAETDIDTYISGRHLQSDRQAHTASQTAICTQLHSDTGRYRQIVPIQSATHRN